jgi:transcriptional regulator with XRE-family HTH domain
MNLGQKIEQLLKTTAMTKVELSKKLGLKDSSVVSHWVKNRFKPDRDNMQKLSRVFEKPVSYFADDEGTYCAENGRTDRTEKKIYELLSSFPMAKHVGVMGEISSEYFDLSYYCQPEEFLPVMMETKTSAAFALKITSQNACQWATAGEYAIIVPSSFSPQGKLALVKKDGLCCIKKTLIRKNKIILEDKNRTQTKLNLSDAEIIGQVLAFYRKP